MAVPYTFGGQVGNVNASELDADFSYLTAGGTGGGGGGIVYGPGGGGTGSSSGLGLIFVAANSGVGGTSNAITITTSVVPPSIQFGMHFLFVPLYANSSAVNNGNVTVNINGTGAFPVYVDSSQLTGGEIQPSGGVRLYYSINGSAWGMERINNGNVWLLPQNSQSAAYTTVLYDRGKHIYHPSADVTARAWVIDDTVNYEIGTAITFVNDIGAGVITLSINNSAVLAWFPSGGTGARSLAAGALTTALKVAASRWVLTGTGIS